MLAVRDRGRRAVGGHRIEAIATETREALSRSWQRHSEAGAAARTKAVVARQDAHAWLRGDRARAPSSLDRQPEQARARSCLGTDGTDDRRDPYHPGCRFATRSGHLIEASTRAAAFRSTQPSRWTADCCRLCPRPAVRPSPASLLLTCLQASGIWLAPAATIRPELPPRVVRVSARRGACITAARSRVLRGKRVHPFRICVAQRAPEMSVTEAAAGRPRQRSGLTGFARMKLVLPFARRSAPDSHSP